MYIIPGFEKIEFTMINWPTEFTIKAILDAHISCATFLEIIEFSEGYDQPFMLFPYSKEQLLTWDKNTKAIGGSHWSDFRPSIFFPSIIELSIFLYAFGHLPIREFELRKDGIRGGTKEVKKLLDRMP